MICSRCNCTLMNVEVFYSQLNQVLCFHCTEAVAKEQADRRFGQPHFGHRDQDEDDDED
jgi:hypothetical protein